MTKIFLDDTTIWNFEDEKAKQKVKNNENKLFLLHSIYKMQDRLLLKNREHKVFIANYR